MGVGDLLQTFGIIMLFFSCHVTQAKSRVFYNIAHMTNTVDSVNWALGNGANALEIDIEFNSVSGEPTRFIHSPNSGDSCDCTCMCPMGFGCDVFYPNSVCVVLEDSKNKRLSPCSAFTNAVELLNHIATKAMVALVIIDSKIDGTLSNAVQTVAAIKMLKSLDDDLFNRGYGGNIIVGIPKYDAFTYLKKASDIALNSPYRNRYYFSIDLEKNDIAGVIGKLQTLQNKNIVYGTGLTACWVNPITSDTYKLALVNKIRGAVGMSYMWTLDKEGSMEEAVHYFDGIITNYPGKLRNILQERNIVLAKPSDPIPATSTDSILSSLSDYTCDCSYKPGGCVITRAPPAMFACKCSYKGAWTCGGSIVRCNDQNSRFCTNPDTSVESCVQGSGDCEGYKSGTCDCSYSHGGCRISKPAVAGVACKCSYKGAWTCGGHPVACRNPSSISCKSPSTSAESCIEGGGDCGGYGACDCSYSPGGCKISQQAPPNAACQCLYKGAWTCGGTLVHCLSSTASKCINPDQSAESCALGGGDCGGYGNNGCDCNYKSGGCVISRVPPRNTACRCSYRGFWTCSGSIVKCSNFSDQKCINPDRSKETCRLGGGDCGGY